jgi:predicted RNase H-like HicB family nuclease
MKSYRFSVVIEKDKDGYLAFCPELQGCYTQGYTYEEALENVEDAISLHVKDRLEPGEELPDVEFSS